MLPELTWLENPEIFRVNRLNAHSDHICYPNESELNSGHTSLRQSLDGDWLFQYSRCPAERPAEFFREDYDCSFFDIIKVPGHIETQGYDRIQYINKLYDWDGHVFLRPPHIDWDYCPVGSYVTYFDLEDGLKNKPVCISFQGVEQAFYVWLNGHFIGYSEDSFSPSEFDLSPYIRDTGNKLAVEVYKRCSGGWLECQDFFSFSGIFRSVYLYAKLPVTVEDMWLMTSLDEDNSTGRLKVRLLASGTNAPDIMLRISHPEDGLLWEGQLSLTETDGYLFSQELVFPGIRLWDHDCPELYNVLLSVKYGGFIPYSVGFRRFEIKNKLLLLNGKRLILKGVNRHEWNAESGRSIGHDDMTAAMRIFLKNNINAVRTCHYPNQTEWYHMCDKYGIYMMDETNLETHGSWQKDMKVDPEWNIPGSLPEWQAAVLDRANSMFQRDKNHTSILFWSCGNESYAGTDIAAIADFFRAVDPSRVVHYEGVFWCREFDYISDVESRMYATPDEIREYLSNDPQKPYLSCEYMHCMGNSLGGLESYIKLEDDFEMYHGGFLWDYMDQALWHINAQGTRVLGYGGDFEDRQSDYSFSANGIVTADGIPKPCMQDIRYWYSSKEERLRHDERRAESEKLYELSHRPSQPEKQALHIINGDGAFGIQGKGFEILFSKLQGGPVSMLSGGREWLWRAPRLAFWRAPTENDLGCSFPQKSAIWRAVDDWQFCSGFEVLSQSTECFSIRYDYTAIPMNTLDASIVYTVNDNGIMNVRCEYKGEKGRPGLPEFGFRFSTPVPIEETKWTGLSGETYPDRHKGAFFGTFTEEPGQAVYLVPQEYGCHMNTHRAKFSIGSAEIRFEKDEKPFYFSALPYTPAKLEQAYHNYELPAFSRSVVTVCGEMRGVGGIDTWMTDVEPAYRISGEEDHSFSFNIQLSPFEYAHFR